MARHPSWFAFGGKAEVGYRVRRVRLFTDFVAKVENRTTPKISRRCFSESRNVTKRHHNVRRSGPENRRSSTQNDFCNKICTFETCRPALKMSVPRGRPEVAGERSKMTRFTRIGPRADHQTAPDCMPFLTPPPGRRVLSFEGVVLAVLTKPVFLPIHRLDHVFVLSVTVHKPCSGTEPR
jgi:hypothetical protein